MDNDELKDLILRKYRLGYSKEILIDYAYYNMVFVSGKRTRREANNFVERVILDYYNKKARIVNGQ